MLTIECTLTQHTQIGARIHALFGANIDERRPHVGQYEMHMRTIESGVRQCGKERQGIVEIAQGNHRAVLLRVADAAIVGLRGGFDVTTMDERGEGMGRTKDGRT